MLLEWKRVIWMETKQHPVGDFLSMIPLHTCLTYQSDELEKQLKRQEVILPILGPFELHGTTFLGVVQVEHLVDEF
jgi:hypothetical protein